MKNSKLNPERFDALALDRSQLKYISGGRDTVPPQGDPGDTNDPTVPPTPPIPPKGPYIDPGSNPTTP